MLVRERRYPKEEIARRGNDINNRDILPLIHDEQKGHFVAIDIETGQWVMDVSQREAGDILRSRLPDAKTYMKRVGFSFVHRFGAYNWSTRE